MNNKKAFTIIEVVLVLAVAGLIFLVVFAAIPRLQASRRDNQRKRDMEALYALIIEYESNTGGPPEDFSGHGGDSLQAAFPACTATPAGTFYTGYVQGAELEDPSNGCYQFAQTSSPGVGQFYFYHGGTATAGRLCNTDNGSWTGVGADASSWFLLYGLERGEGCLDNG